MDKLKTHSGRVGRRSARDSKSMSVRNVLQKEKQIKQIDLEEKLEKREEIIQVLEAEKDVLIERAMKEIARLKESKKKYKLKARELKDSNISYSKSNEELETSSREYKISIEESRYKIEKIEREQEALKLQLEIATRQNQKGSKEIIELKNGVMDLKDERRILLERIRKLKGDDEPSEEGDENQGLSKKYRTEMRNWKKEKSKMVSMLSEKDRQVERLEYEVRVGEEKKKEHKKILHKLRLRLSEQSKGSSGNSDRQDDEEKKGTDKKRNEIIMKSEIKKIRSHVKTLRRSYENLNEEVDRIFSISSFMNTVTSGINQTFKQLKNEHSEKIGEMKKKFRDLSKQQESSPQSSTKMDVDHDDDDDYLKNLEREMEGKSEDVVLQTSFMEGFPTLDKHLLTNCKIC